MIWVKWFRLRETGKAVMLGLEEEPLLVEDM